MGQAKDQFLNLQDKMHQAFSLCLEQGAITECPVHEGEYIDSMDFLDPDELTDQILSSNPNAINAFTDRKEMVELVQEVLNSAGEECGYCANNRDS